MAILGGNKGQEASAPVKATAPATPPTAPAPVKAAAPAAKGKPGPKPGQKREPLALDLSGLTVATVTDRQEMAKARRTRGERSADQKRLDAMVETAWTAWKEAGSPTEWPKMPGVKLRIPTPQYDTLIAGIRKAGQFYDLKVRFGRAVESGDATEVVFVVMDRPDNDDDNDDNDNDDNES